MALADERVVRCPDAAPRATAAKSGQRSGGADPDRVPRDRDAAAGLLDPDMATASAGCRLSLSLRPSLTVLFRPGRWRRASRAFRRRIAFVCSWETRDSVTPSTSPISRSVSSS